MKGCNRSIAALVCGMALVSCQTTKPVEATQEPAGPAEFSPATYVSRIHWEAGRYPNLFSPDSYAVWVGPEVTALKRANEEAVPTALDAVAGEIGEDYLVFECHIGSAFGDISIAYDVVGFRGIDVYLRGPDGQSIRPIQTVIDTSAAEEQHEALKLFRRTNLVVFPRHNPWSDAPTLGLESSSMQLVLKGYNSEFYFEWSGVKSPGESRWRPSDSEAVQAARLGFNELYHRIRRLAQKFH